MDANDDDVVASTQSEIAYFLLFVFFMSLGMTIDTSFSETLADPPPPPGPAITIIETLPPNPGSGGSGQNSMTGQGGKEDTTGVDPPGCLVSERDKVLNHAFLIRVVGDSVTMSDDAPSPKFHRTVTESIATGWAELQRQVENKIFDRTGGKVEDALRQFADAAKGLLPQRGSKPACHVRVKVTFESSARTAAAELALRLHDMSLHGVVVRVSVV